MSLWEPFYESLSLLPLPNNHPSTTEKIDKILNDEIIFKEDSGTWRYLICWKGKSPTEDTWLDRSDLKLINPDVLEHEIFFYTSLDRVEFSLPHGENDEDIKDMQGFESSLYFLFNSSLAACPFIF